jgi:uncharacterized delta-60 repeat protein
MAARSPVASRGPFRSSFSFFSALGALGARPRVGSLALVAALAAPLAASAIVGCSLVLGFEDTTLRTANADGGTTEAGPGDEEGGAPAEGGTTRLTARPTSIVVRRGASADVTVDLVRGSDVTGPVTLRVSGLPLGVTAPNVTLSPPAASATIKLSAQASATLGSKTVTLSADGTSLAAVPISLLVADAAGALDVTFDAAGFVTDPSRGTGTTFLALAVQPDQRIVAGGGAAAMPGALSGWVIRRHAVNGAPDGAFNAAANAAGVAPADGELHALAIDAKGRTVCAGFSQGAPQQQLTVVRLLPTGALDTTFAGGVVRLPVESPGPSFGFAVAVQPDNAVVVVGSRRDLLGNNETGILTRFTENGARDATFNGGATVTVPGSRLIGVAIEGGKVLVAGSTIGGALPSYFVNRRTATGANDPTFGNAGTAAFGNTYRANAFARLADGSFALVGDVQQGAQGYTAGVANAQGNAVFARTYANAAGAGFFGLGVQSDGRIVAAGHTAVSNGEARVERILPDGNKDPTFGTGGTAIIKTPGAALGFEVTLFASAVQADGRILAAGNRTNAGGIIYRLWP